VWEDVDRGNAAWASMANTIDWRFDGHADLFVTICKWAWGVAKAVWKGLLDLCEALLERILPRTWRSETKPKTISAQPSLFVNYHQDFLAVSDNRPLWISSAPPSSSTANSLWRTILTVYVRSTPGSVARYWG